jgi:hypothetical protein
VEKEENLLILGLFDCEYKQNILSANLKSRHLIWGGQLNRRLFHKQDLDLFVTVNTNRTTRK